MLIHPPQEEKEKVLQQLDQEQISSESKNHMETFKRMQINSPMLQHANYKVLAGAPPQEKSECMEGGQTGCE